MASDEVDPFTMEARLCGDDGIVRRGAMPCTGHAHFDGMPSWVLDALRHPDIDLEVEIGPDGKPCSVWWEQS